MFSFPAPTVYEASKCYASWGTMAHIQPDQPPSKGQPWITFKSQDFLRKVDVVMPQDAFEAVRGKFNGVEGPVYQRVIMSLQDIVTGDFFSEYIKKGNIVMLSEGRIGIDNVFSLKDGKLAMFLDKETYERAGLVGKPHGVKGKRGLKPRWIVEFDLLEKSMFPGKKGFDRLVFASKNALSSTRTWFFTNLATTPQTDPLAKHFPVKYTCKPGTVGDFPAVVPSLRPSNTFLAPHGKEQFDDFAAETYEWLSLVRLESPRVVQGDKIDPFLSRYRVPGEPEDCQETKLCMVTWQGFMSPSWAKELLIELITALPSKAWYSFSTSTFGHGVAGDGSEVTILRPPSAPGEYLLWEVKGHE